MPIDPRTLETKVMHLSDMPTFPHVVRHISALVESNNASASDIGALISKDQVITGKVLRLVNSPVYGFPSRISSITHALVLLGFTVVKGLVLSTAVFDTFGVKTHGLWRHSLGCAIISRCLARETQMADIEEVMIAGLLHDLGKAVVAFLAPQEWDRTLVMADMRRCHIAHAEREVFGVDHARVASWIAREWHLPPALSEPLTYHHRPDLAKKAHAATAVVHVADILARAMGYGHPGDRVMPPFDAAAFETLGVSYEQLERVLCVAETDFKAGLASFADP
jgi:HD-like signal output (HDOD) protein